MAAGAWLTAPLAIPLLGGMIALGAGLLLFYAVGLPSVGRSSDLFALGRARWIFSPAGRPAPRS